MASKSRRRGGKSHDDQAASSGGPPATTEPRDSTPDDEGSEEALSVRSLWEKATSNTTWGEDPSDRLPPQREGATQPLPSFDHLDSRSDVVSGEGPGVPSQEDTIPGTISLADEATVVSGDPEETRLLMAQRRALRYSKQGDGHTGAASDGGTLPIPQSPEEIDAEVRRLEHEVVWLTERDRHDDVLSTLHLMVRMKPEDGALLARYEAMQQQVIDAHFPGKTAHSVASLTVDPSELPELIQDPVMGAILGRLDGRVSLGQLDAALGDVAPGVLYGLLSRAKGMGLIRLD